MSRGTLQWRHNERNGVSNHQPHNCLVNRLFGRWSKKTSKLRVTSLCAGNSPRTGEFPAQRASNAANVSIWWRHHRIIMSDQGGLNGTVIPFVRCTSKNGIFNVSDKTSLPFHEEEFQEHTSPQCRKTAENLFSLFVHPQQNLARKGLIILLKWWIVEWSTAHLTLIISVSSSPNCWGRVYDRINQIKRYFHSNFIPRTR